MTGSPAFTVTSTHGLSRADWLKLRQSGIGGSDCWRIVLDPSEYRFAGPAELYREKLESTPTDSPSLPARVGVSLEPLIADLFAETTGYRVHRVNAMFRSNAHPFAIADIDRKLYGRNVGLECKSIGVWAARKRITDPESGVANWIDRFREGDPSCIAENKPEWLLQTQHYMMVTGWKTWFLAVLVGNDRFCTFQIDRDDELIADLAAAEGEFWQHVQCKDEFYDGGKNCETDKDYPT